MSERQAIRSRVRSGDKLPDVEVPVVPGEERGGSKGADTVRVLDGTAFLLHYRHVQARRARDGATARCCRSGPGAVVLELEVPRRVSGDEVVRDSGGDEKGSGARAPGSHGS